jgi:hypothetical protein
MLAMRLFAAARLAASGLARKAASACSRASMSRGERGEVASTASSCSPVTCHVWPTPSPPAAFEIVGAQPLLHVLQDIGRGGRALHRLGRDGGVDQRRQVEVETLLDAQSQHADRGATQAKGVLRAARLLANRKDAGEGVEAIRERDRQTHAGCRQRIAGTARHVVLADTGADIARLAIGGGVVRAHDALQFRKLTDHRADQIAFGEFG